MLADTPAASGRKEGGNHTAGYRTGREDKGWPQLPALPQGGPDSCRKPGVGGCSCLAAACRAGQPREHSQRNERAHGGHADNERVAVVASEPDADWQGYDFRHAGHDPEQAQSFASPFRWQQRGREGAGGDTGEAEAEAANDADRHRDDQRASRQQRQGWYAQ